MTKAEREQRERIAERDSTEEFPDGACQERGPYCTGQGQAIHHVVHKGLGGRHGAAKKAIEDDLNLKVICRACHIWIHDKQVLHV